jgi:NAD(P)-dependent dehydrogenase (short-subunit alcohol dehydrogenase family)
MENNLAAISMNQGMGILGHALLPDLKLPMIATPDVGDYAARRLLDLDFSGKQTRELLGQRDLSMAEATAIIAHGIGKPDLRYEQFSYDQVQQVLEQMGMPPKKAAVYIEMFKEINASVLAAQEPRSQENTTPTSFEQCATNVRSPFFLVQQLLPILGEGSNIIVISSLGSRAVPGKPAVDTPSILAYSSTSVRDSGQELGCNSWTARHSRQCSRARCDRYGYVEFYED